MKVKGLRQAWPLPTPPIESSSVLIAFNQHRPSFTEQQKFLSPSASACLSFKLWLAIKYSAKSYRSLFSRARGLDITNLYANHSDKQREKAAAVKESRYNFALFTFSRCCRRLSGDIHNFLFSLIFFPMLVVEEPSGVFNAWSFLLISLLIKL